MGRGLRERCYKVNLGMAARFVESKAHVNLIAALQFLPSEFVLHFAGDGELFDKCRRLVIDSHLENRVVFHGDVSNIQGFYSKLDLYVQASFWEGFGLTVVEANFSGLPVAYSLLDGLKEILCDTEVSFDPYSPKDMARAIQFMNRNRAAVLEAQSLKMRKYTLKSHLEKLNALYDQFI